MTPHPHIHAARSCRRGISLLEVLISIGILGVGLLAALSLVPVGRSYLAKAVVDDQAAVAISAGYDTLTTAGLFAENSLTDVPPNNAANEWVRAAAVDPMMATRLDEVITRQGIIGDTPITRARQDLATFNQTGRVLRVPRLSLAALSPATPAQRVALADRLCRMHDDLEVDDDVTDERSGKRDEFAPPKPVFAAGPSGPLARQTIGRQSWFFLLQPQAPGSFMTNWTPGSVFDASIVIFRDRPFRTLDGSAPVVTGEYVFDDAAWDPAQGLLLIPVPKPLAVNGEQVFLEDEDLRAIFRAGGWLLLGPKTPYPGPSATNRQKLVWVRAQTVEISGSGQSSVVTILPETEPPADVLGGAAGVTPIPLVALVYEGVIAVATKQITVQGP